MRRRTELEARAVMAKVPWFYVTCDLMADYPDNVRHESPYGPDVHEYDYTVYDDDGVLCAMGTTTGEVTPDDDLEGWYRAHEYHQADVGTTNICLTHRVTRKVTWPL